MSIPPSEVPRARGGFSLPMSRREAVRRLVLLCGSAIIGAHVLLRADALAGLGAGTAFAPGDRALLDEIGETILPATEIPGAKAAQIGAFMIMMVNDCYSAKEAAVFRDGLVRVDQASREKFGKSFLEASPAQRTELANALDAERRAHEGRKGAEALPHYFQMMKELTVLCYFSSEIGCTQALRYIEVPGAFHGDVPYKKGDRAWFV